MRPEVAPVSQTERLRSAMAASTITHGQTVRADIERVEVSTKAYARALVYFCGIHGVKVRETVQAGDGGPLPVEVAVAGLEVDREGIYDIRNALISSNGRIQIAVDGRSRVVPARKPLMGFSLLA
ncbi:MAG TPA: hypothetical protein VJL31_10680 [Gemmatimonadales bacterium]|jgi:hypothetical protein|nr:hypothetical protein [Gemmatimonadales bacterium]